MSVTINLKIRLGPLVSLEINGDNCKEISEALSGFDHLNQQIESICSDLADRIYPEGMETGENDCKKETEVKQ